MHTIFTTEGIVLGKRVIGEANTTVALLTREFGVIRVSARSARLERSKLRYGLETLTRGRFALIRARYDWKLTGAHELSRNLAGGSLASRRATGRINRLLLRLIHGEEPVPELYASVAAGLSYLSSESNEADIEQIECIIVLRILSHLGYVEQDERVQPFTETAEFSPALIGRAKEARTFLLRTINGSLGATGL